MLGITCAAGPGETEGMTRRKALAFVRRSLPELKTRVIHPTPWGPQGRTSPWERREVRPACQDEGQALGISFFRTNTDIHERHHHDSANLAPKSGLPRRTPGIVVVAPAWQPNPRTSADVSADRRRFTWTQRHLSRQTAGPARCHGSRPRAGSGE